MTSSSGAAPSERTTVTRYPNRGHYDRATIDDALDAGLISHLAMAQDGVPRLIPTWIAEAASR